MWKRKQRRERSQELKPRFGRSNSSPFSIELDYPVKPEPRFGHGKPPHPQIVDALESYRERFEAFGQNILQNLSRFESIHRSGTGSENEPRWINEFLPVLDAAALYTIIQQLTPSTYLEIGSGESTRFARRSIRDSKLSTQVISIDPEPRRNIESICDDVLRTPLEETSLEVFKALRADDIVFFDGSHRIFTGSDVTVFFLEVLPILPSGVYVQIHDVYLPYDYPPELNSRYYTEQYLLAVQLLAADPGFDVVLSNSFVTRDDSLYRMLDPLWSLPQLQGAEFHGESFWLRTR